MCVWHINNNVQTMAQYTWRDDGGVTKEKQQRIAEKRVFFMKRWSRVCSDSNYEARSRKN